MIDQRLADLRIAAVKEGIVWNPASEADLRSYLKTIATEEPGIVLLDNGNLRAVWKSESQHLGLEFRGGGEVQYVAYGRARYDDFSGIP